MKKGEQSRADVRPQPLEIRKLFKGRNIYELTAYEDVIEETVTRDAGGGEDAESRVEFVFTTRRAAAKLDGYEEAAAALIGLKYSFADEFALMRKGMAEPENSEYAEYLEFVAECKAFAREYFAEAAE